MSNDDFCDNDEPNRRPTNLSALESYYRDGALLFGSDEHDHYVVHVTEELPHIMAELRYLRQVERAAWSMIHYAVNEAHDLHPYINALHEALEGGDPGPSQAQIQDAEVELAPLEERSSATKENQ